MTAKTSGPHEVGCCRPTGSTAGSATTGGRTVSTILNRQEGASSTGTTGSTRSTFGGAWKGLRDAPELGWKGGKGWAVGNAGNAPSRLLCRCLAAITAPPPTRSSQPNVAKGLNIKANRECPSRCGNRIRNNPRPAAWIAAAGWGRAARRPRFRCLAIRPDFQRFRAAETRPTSPDPAPIAPFLALVPNRRSACVRCQAIGHRAPCDPLLSRVQFLPAFPGHALDGALAANRRAMDSVGINLQRRRAGGGNCGRGDRRLHRQQLALG